MFIGPTIVILVLAVIGLVRWWMVLRVARHMVDHGDAKHIDKLAALTKAFGRPRRRSERN